MTALVCGGIDEMANLQWLDLATHKAKTRLEVARCRTKDHSVARNCLHR